MCPGSQKSWKDYDVADFSMSQLFTDVSIQLLIYSISGQNNRLGNGEIIIF